MNIFYLRGFVVDTHKDGNSVLAELSDAALSHVRMLSVVIDLFAINLCSQSNFLLTNRLNHTNFEMMFGNPHSRLK